MSKSPGLHTLPKPIPLSPGITPQNLPDTLRQPYHDPILCQPLLGILRAAWLKPAKSMRKKALQEPMIG